MRALHATVLSSLGPARKYTAKFEPAAWSWAQVTSGFGAQKRIRAQNAPGAHRARPRGVYRYRGVYSQAPSGSAPNTRTVMTVTARDNLTVPHAVVHMKQLEKLMVTPRFERT